MLCAYITKTSLGPAAKPALCMLCSVPFTLRVFLAFVYFLTKKKKKSQYYAMFWVRTLFSKQKSLELNHPNHKHLNTLNKLAPSQKPFNLHHCFQLYCFSSCSYFILTPVIHIHSSIAYCYLVCCLIFVALVVICNHISQF